MTSSDDLNKLIAKHLEEFAADVPVSSEILAAESYKDIDPDDVAPALVAWGCVLTLRQMARKLLRRQYDDHAPDDAQQELFSGLQDRYPGFGEERGIYYPRMQLTLADRLRTVERLRREAQSKVQHADALEAETEDLKARGFFDDQGAG